MTKTLKRRAYDYVRGKLERGELMPGDRLSEIPLAEGLGISRTPMREAIGQLASEGFVELVPRAGAYVKRPDATELRQLSELRAVLEGHAAAKAAAIIPRPMLEHLRATHNELWELLAGIRDAGQHELTQAQARRMRHANLSFHATILNAADNECLSRLVSDFRIRGRAPEQEEAPPPVAILEQCVLEHTEILVSIEAAHPQRAADAMAAHISAQAPMMKGVDAQIPNKPIVPHAIAVPRDLREP